MYPFILYFFYFINFSFVAYYITHHNYTLACKIYYYRS